MRHITLLIADTDFIEDTNYLRLGNELLRRGFIVHCCFMDSLAMLGSKVTAMGFLLDEPLVVDRKFPDRHQHCLNEADIVWTLTLGMRHSFLDKIQLLHCLKNDCQLINSLEALMHFKSKYFLSSHPEVFQYPETFASTSPTELLGIIQDKGGKWIAKPPAGSLGRNIFLLDPKDPNARVILESMTGSESDQYCMIQPHVEEIGLGEKRVLIAGGEPIGQYLRQNNGDHRTNVSAGATVTLCDLTEAERAYCLKIGDFLKSEGALFVGLDLAFPWVIEFNVINPGGIQTIMSMGGKDLAPQVIDQIFPESVPSA
jgi:glutathione synthase